MAVSPSEFGQLGFSIHESVVGVAHLEALSWAADTGAGLRNLLDLLAVAEVARGCVLTDLVAPILGPDAFAVRAILFDKTPDANWKVTWHQDLTIAVRERREVPGFTSWSEKAGVSHVQPPVSILANMLAVRLHLDDCGLDNGPVRVLPGSHLHGRIAEPDIPGWRQRVAEVVCTVPRGGVLLMRPLLLHASSPATSPSRRRVLHIEYAANELPGGLEWKWRVGRS